MATTPIETTPIGTTPMQITPIGTMPIEMVPSGATPTAMRFGLLPQCPLSVLMAQWLGVWTWPCLAHTIHISPIW